jgi:hypothetical protein
MRGEFEVHLTASAADAVTLTRFRDWCVGKRFKCVHIVLARGDSVSQPMATWRRGDATLAGVVAEAHGRAAEVAAGGIPVTRVKVEAAPGNPGVPATDADPHAPGCYFEHHAKLLRDADDTRDRLLEVCERFGAHLSRNAFKVAPAGREERFVTLRCHRVGRATAAARFTALLTALAAVGETVVDSESEYCVHDTNLTLDAGWLPEVPR